MGLHSQEESDTQAGPENEENARIDGVDSSEADGAISAEEQALIDQMASPEDFEGMSAQLEIAQETDAEKTTDGQEEEEAETQEESGEEAETEDREDGGEEEESDSDEAEGEKGDESDDDDGEEDEDGESEAKRARRYRLRTDDPVKAKAYELLRRNQDMGLAEAEARAKAELGIADGDSGDSEEDEGDESGEADARPATATETRSEIERLVEERENILTNELDFEKARDIDKRIRDLQDHLGDLRIREIEERRLSEETYRTKIEESKSRAVELYSFVTDRESAEVRRMEEIDRELKENGDPLFHSPDKPLRLAQMVAAEYGVAPKTRPSSKQEGGQKPSPGKPPRNKGTVTPASAGARTQPTSHEGQLEERIDGIKDPLEWEEFMNA